MPVRAAFTVRCGRSPKSLSLEENVAAVQVAVISLCIRGYQRSPWREAIKALALPLSSCAVTPMFQRGNNLAALFWRIYHIIIRPALSISVVYRPFRAVFVFTSSSARSCTAAPDKCCSGHTPAPASVQCTAPPPPGPSQISAGFPVPAAPSGSGYPCF